MDILPVLDLKGGHVVRGVAGDRENYRPIESVVCSGSGPTEVARAIADQFGFDRFYVADIDGLSGGRVDDTSVRALLGDGRRLLLDAGVSRPETACELLALGVQTLVAPLERLQRPQDLEELLDVSELDRWCFSLDLRRGLPVADAEEWSRDPIEIARRVLDLGVREMIVLDVASVGVRGGPTTDSLCARLREEAGDVSLISG
ncbi:MAG: HisA/HisF-related TIM barrel protein, partial [Planctomycetota bacterium]